jgi:hypothetical protein
MAPLLFTCPTTHRRAPTRVETDPKSLAAAWKRTLKVECPHCGEMHRVTVRDAYIAFAVQDGTDPIVVDRPPGVAPPPPKGFIPRRARPVVYPYNTVPPHIILPNRIADVFNARTEPGVPSRLEHNYPIRVFCPAKQR